MISYNPAENTDMRVQEQGRGTQKIGIGLALLGTVLIFGPSCSKEQVARKTIEGVIHVINPAEPIMGVVRLQVEQTLKINHYDHEEVGLRYFRFCRGAEGDLVILYNPNQVEAQMFDEKGKSLGPLLRQGQGPAEFSSFFRVFITEDKILATGNLKLARFDRAGKLLGEMRIKDYSVRLIDEQSYIAVETTPDEKGLFTKIVHVDLSDRKDVEPLRTILFEAAGVGMIRLKSGGGFGSSWVTPEVLFALGRTARTVYLAHNKEYKIFNKELKGELLRVIEMPHKVIKLSRGKDAAACWPDSRAAT